MKHFSGAYAAVLTPRQQGALDCASFERQLAFLVARGIKGIAINGATGEFPDVTETELAALLQSAREQFPQLQILCGIGSASLRTTVRLGRLASQAGASALLLPMPYFFRYRQDDLLAFVSAVVEKLEAPILLYNLPQFTTGLEPSTVIELMRRHEQIAGVKDSSGLLDIMRAVTEHQPDRVRLIGNDAVLAAAMQDSLCDGVVSGVACVLPELISSFFHHSVASSEFEHSRALLDEFLARIGTLPIPWGLKVISEARGIISGEFPLPLSPERRAEVAALHNWFSAWSSALSRTDKA
ncbi:MAG: dihydrodipicolinate synthase family protein [Acidobacteria bacterium]|nr:dihydrodipicolinate synthase family protein [Acidobacteriota bacterium]MBW4044238.1 dihydrodipicolinate synthase family protein [Acidobacteriota bacterium]